MNRISGTAVRHTLLSAVSALLCVSVAGLLVGCKSEQKSFSLDSLIKKGLGGGGPNPQQMVAMAFDPDDADRRRTGIKLLSSEKWGLDEPYTKGYSALAKTDVDPLVRSAAVRALGKSGKQEYQGTLIEALKDPSPMVRWDAAVALDLVPGPAAVEPLRRQGGDDTSADVRTACAKALRRYTTRPAVQTLIRLLDDSSYQVRHQARKSLEEATGRDLGPEPSAWMSLLDGPLTRPAERVEYAWWDWMHVYGETVVEEPSTPASQPAQR
ncbi:MAG: putative lyase [Planctomycetes bacterium ADurb.Bin126]|nr:MAG: putative lyase [Planctomycetes bacterium ADurb.Bin126]